MDWPGEFVVFLVLHLVGDFALQTEWQAQHKRGGLGRDAVARRELDQTSHFVALLGLAVVAAA